MHCLSTWHLNLKSSKMLLTFCHTNLSQPTHPEILLKEALDAGNWLAAPKPFADLKDELCQKCVISLRNNHIVIHGALPPCILQLAHKGQLGIAKVKQHLRQRVWWPGIVWLPNRGPHTSPRAPLNDRSTKTSTGHRPYSLQWPVSIRRVYFCSC